MSPLTADQVRSRILEMAIDLGWTPPGWRSAPYPSEPRVIDRIGDLALRGLLQRQASQLH